jgi:hypothetical protein
MEIDMWPLWKPTRDQNHHQRADEYKNARRIGRVRPNLFIKEYGQYTYECTDCYGTGQLGRHYGGRVNSPSGSCELCDGRGRTQTFSEQLSEYISDLMRIEREGQAIRRLCAKNPKVEGETPHYCWAELDEKRKEWRRQKDINDEMFEIMERYDDPNQPNTPPGPKYVRTMGDDFADLGWNIMKGLVALYLFCFAVVPGCGI